MKCIGCQAEFDLEQAGDLPRVFRHCNECSRARWAKILSANPDQLFQCRLLAPEFQPPEPLAGLNFGIHCPTYWEAVGGIGENGLSFGVAKTYNARKALGGDPTVARQVPLADIVGLRQQSGEKTPSRQRVLRISAWAALVAAALLFLVSCGTVAKAGGAPEEAFLIAAAAGICCGSVVFGLNYLLRFTFLDSRRTAQVHFQVQNSEPLLIEVEPGQLEKVLNALESLGVNAEGK